MAEGLEPGQPNQGLVAEMRTSSARLARRRRHPARYPIGFTMPETVEVQSVDQCHIWFETNVDNYGRRTLTAKLTAAAAS